MKHRRRSPRLPAMVLSLLGMLGSCTFTGVEGLQSLRQKPALPYSVMITGGGFVQAPGSRETSFRMPQTFAKVPAFAEAFSLDELRSHLDSGNVFVVNEADAWPRADRLEVSRGQLVNDAILQSALARAREGGHDFLLIVEGIQDGPVELREINDRWPFTIAAWLFGLGALIPDHTYESEARLRVSLRDVYSGRRVSDQQIIVEPGPIDLNMIERCSLLGFVQSVLWPPFFTSTDSRVIIDSMDQESAPRMLLALVRRLKSAEVRDQLFRSGSVMLSMRPVSGGVQVSVDSQEPISAVALRFDGVAVQGDVVEGFEDAVLKSGRKDGEQWRYQAVYRGQHPRGVLQVTAQTEAAKVRSMTLRIGGN